MEIWSDRIVLLRKICYTILRAFWLILPMDERAKLRLYRRIKAFAKSLRPQDRPDPINYRSP